MLLCLSCRIEGLENCLLLKRLNLQNNKIAKVEGWGEQAAAAYTAGAAMHAILLTLPALPTLLGP